MKVVSGDIFKNKSKLSYIHPWQQKPANTDRGCHKYALSPVLSSSVALPVTGTITFVLGGPMSTAAVTMPTGRAVLIVLSIAPPVVLFATPVIVAIVASSSFATIRTDTIPIAITIPLAIALIQHHRGRVAAADSFRALTITIGAVHVTIVAGGSLVPSRAPVVPFLALLVLLRRIHRRR